MKMKWIKIGAMAVAGIMALTSLSLSSFVTAAETADLMQDTFEEGYGGWKGVGSTVTITGDQAHSGSKALYVHDRTASWGAPRCSLSGIVVAGKKYDFSASAMFEGSGSQQIALKMLYTDSSGTDHYDAVASVQASAGEWVTLSGSYTIPSDATGMTLYVEMPNANTDQCYYIDDVLIHGEKTDIQLDTSFRSDFEDGTTQRWNGRGSATAELSKNFSHSGDNSLYISGRTQLWNGATLSVANMMEAGGYYKVGCYVLYTGDEYSDTQKFSINLQYDLNGEEKYYTIATETANKNEWTYVGSEFTVPAGATNFYVYVQTGYTSSPNAQDLMDFYMDDAFGEHLPDPAIQDDITALKDAYRDYFKLGCACAGSEFSQGATKDLIQKHYNSLTLGNELKPDSVLDQAKSIAYLQATGDDTAPQISLNEADEMLKFAGENGIPVRGHVLVWHSQTPDWFFKENYDADGAWVDKETMTKRMENYIKIVMETLAADYPEVEFYAWDVVNEAASDAGTIRPAGSNNKVNGQSAWVQVYGDQSYIPLAFQFARQYAPAGCKLFYNDYNEYSPAKQTYIIDEILTPLVEAGLIDGMGMQSHISMNYPSVDLYRNAIQNYADLGLEIQITELDISQKSNTDADQLELAKRYQDVFKLYKELKDDISAVVLWGITDSTSWIGGYPLLFDKDYQAKPAYYAVIDTDSQVETLKTMSSYYYDGTEKDLEHALAISTPQYLANGTCNTYFKAVWNEDGMVIRVYNPIYHAPESPKRSQVTVYVHTETNLIIKSADVHENDNYLDLTIEELTGKVGDTIRLEITNEAAGWDSQTFAANAYSGLTWGAIPHGGIVTLKAQPNYAEATKGTVTIDGEIDDAWATANSIQVNNFSLGNGATGVSKMLWDENYIYILTEVTDPVLSAASANAYEQDTVEVFLDENNHKTSSYESDDIQVRINFENDKTVTDGRSTADFLSAAKKTANGYLVEVALPFTIAPYQAGQMVGFDVQINDDGTGDGKRTGISNWNDLTGQGYIDTSGFGVMQLVDATEPIVTTTTSDITTTTTVIPNALYGDVNLDNDVSLSDLVTFQKFLRQAITFNDQQCANANVDLTDMKINDQDATALMKFLIKLIDVIPIQ